MKLTRHGLVRTAFWCLAIARCHSLAHAEMQTLTDRQGRSIKADVISVTGDKVKIKRDDGQTFDLPLSNLAEADQKNLKAWAARESAKSLPAGALVVEMSRGIFKTEKTEQDVKIVGGGVVKDGIAITEEKWGYNVTITNKTSRPIEGLRAEYRLFATIDDLRIKEKQGLKKKAFQSEIETIPALNAVVFKTETISAIKTKFKGNIVSATSGDTGSRETLSGIWMRIYRGTELVYESAMPEKLATTEKW